ncbi:hypothetical protein BB559_005570 [Furculomyces boomerangus]|uniref:Uncharacterized protein n=1 Tax=Furculomyces boomerangus TaxID=61424 RepID=A0A2T9Y7V3_9FUNG|nr:hypothetical protein BB559_005570 [Furculomyces boomerangus]
MDEQQLKLRKRRQERILKAKADRLRSIKLSFETDSETPSSPIFSPHDSTPNDSMHHDALLDSKPSINLTDSPTSPTSPIQPSPSKQPKPDTSLLPKIIPSINVPNSAENNTEIFTVLQNSLFDFQKRSFSSKHLNHELIFYALPLLFTFLALLFTTFDFSAAGQSISLSDISLYLSKSTNNVLINSDFSKNVFLYFATLELGKLAYNVKDITRNVSGPAKNILLLNYFVKNILDTTSLFIFYLFFFTCFHSLFS